MTPETVRLTDGSAVRLRSPGPDDAAALLVYLDAVRQESQGIMFGPDDELPTLDWERNWLDQAKQRDHGLMAGAWAGDQLVGLADHSGGEGMLRQRHRAALGISIRKAWWGRGLGRVLMDRLIRSAERDKLIHVVQLSVFSSNHRAAALYEKCGFEREGVRRWSVRFEDGTLTDEVMMSRWVGPDTAPDAGNLTPKLGRYSISNHGDEPLESTTFSLAVDDGLALRLDQPEHADEIYALVDANREHLGPWMPWVEETKSVDVTRRVGGAMRRQFAVGTEAALAVVEHGHAVGKIGLHDINSDTGSAELGYWLAADALGRGVITRAARRLIDYAFRERGLRRVFLSTDANNKASRAVAERLGMRQEATFRQDLPHHHGGYRDSVHYAVLASEWNRPEKLP